MDDKKYDLWSDQGIETPPPPKPVSTDTPAWVSLQPPVIWREIVAVLAGIILFDATVYHGAGYAGIAALILGWTTALWFGALKPRFGKTPILFFFLILLVCAKLVWCGFTETAVAGFVLLGVFGAWQVGRKLRVFELLEYASQICFAGGTGINDYGKFLGRGCTKISPGIGLSLGLPLAALLGFGTIFVMANPDLVSTVQKWFGDLSEFLSLYTNWLPNGFQVVLWFLAGWILVGMIRPLESFRELWSQQSLSGFGETGSADETTDEPTAARLSPFYTGCRNMLFAVIALFAAYLVFEFKTLWFRKFPEGFCYSGYSHQGAAWLVVALAVSTVILSLVFQKTMFDDPRIATLKRLAWIWSALNFVLALAVYNRLFIYIGFNGVTRMRVIGLLGMTAVLIGFVLVVRKISERKTFAWLMSRFTWTVLVMMFLDFTLPVDWLVHRYNVARILGGDPAPSVQLTVHPCSNEGYLTLLPIVEECKDQKIWAGVRAMLAKKLDELETAQRQSAPEGKYYWTQFQLSDVCLLIQLKNRRDLFTKYIELDEKSGNYRFRHAEADDAIRQFHEYAYRWY